MEEGGNLLQTRNFPSTAVFWVLIMGDGGDFLRQGTTSSYIFLLSTNISTKKGIRETQMYEKRKELNGLELKQAFFSPHIKTIHSIDSIDSTVYA